MGSGDKKQRREVNRVLHRFSIRYGDDVYAFREHLAAKEMLVEYAEPLGGLFDTLTTRYAVAVFAWNLSLVAEDRRAELIKEFIEPIIGDNDAGRKVLSDLIEAMVGRREDLYPNENGLILPTEDEEPYEAPGLEVSEDEQDEGEDEQDEDESLEDR